MATFSDSNRLLKLTTPLGADKLLVLGYSGQERVNGLFEFALDLIAPRDDFPDVTRLIGKGATLSINSARQNAFEAEGKRVIHGVISQFGEVGQLQSNVGNEAFDYLRFRAVLVPWLWNLGSAADCRIFQDKTAPQIIEQVFKDRGFSEYRLALTGTHEKRAYCVQYRETDLAFVSRLMEEEGIFYFFEHKDGEHKMVLADSKSVHQSCGPADGVSFKPQRQAAAASIRAWSERRAITTAKYAMQSYNFETPSTSLLASVDSTINTGKNTSLEVYDFPQDYGTKSSGDQLAKLRIEAIEMQHHSCEGASDCAYLTPGLTFKLIDHYRSDQNTEYLVTGVSHEARNDGYEQLLAGWSAYYENAFDCIPKSVQYRAPLATPKPRIQGVQSALVVGPSSEEIYTDKYGRIKVQFHWDRLGKKDADSSCWMRVAQSLASNQWGAQYIPRVGQEVLVDFLDGDPDLPIVTGALYNAQKMPPYTLPDNKTQSGLKTRSSKEGTAENFNELRFEDKKGEEDVYFHAEKDFHRVVKNNDDLVVGADDDAADGSQTISIKKNRTETVKEGDETVTIEKGKRVVTVKEGDETLEVSKGKRTVTVGQGDDVHEVSQGKRSVTIGQGNDELTVSQGKRSVTISVGNDELTISQGNQTTTISVGKSETSAAQSIELKVGSNSIKIDTSGITIKGAMLKLQGDGSAELKAASVTVDGSGQTELKGGGMLKAQGGMVQINGDGMTQVKAGGILQLQGALNQIG